MDSIYIYIYSYIYYIICRVCLWAYSGEWATRMTDKVSARSRVLKIYIQLWFLYCLFFFFYQLRSPFIMLLLLLLLLRYLGWYFITICVRTISVFNVFATAAHGQSYLFTLENVLTRQQLPYNLTGSVNGTTEPDLFVDQVDNNTRIILYKNRKYPQRSITKVQSVHNIIVHL